MVCWIVQHSLKFVNRSTLWSFGPLCRLERVTRKRERKREEVFFLFRGRRPSKLLRRPYTAFSRHTHTLTLSTVKHFIISSQGSFLNGFMYLVFSFSFQWTPLATLTCSSGLCSQECYKVLEFVLFDGECIHLFFKLIHQYFQPLSGIIPTFQTSISKVLHVLSSLTQTNMINYELRNLAGKSMGLF